MPTPLAAPEPALQGAARLLAEGRPAAAAERLAGIVAETPTYAAAHVLRATALEAAGFVDEALVAWGRAAALVPRSPLVHRARARLLATRVADAPGDALPPPVPDPSASAPEPEAREPEAREPEPQEPPAPEAQAPAPEPPPVDPEDDGADGPLLDFGMPASLEASDLLFTSAPPPPPPPDDGPPSPAPVDPPPPTAPLQPIPADWGADETGLAPVLPPFEESAGGPADAPPDAPTDAPAADAMGPLGWDLLSEHDVPTPPPGATVAPDVVAPEGDIHPAPQAEEAPQDARSVVDELDDLIAQLEVAPRIRPDPAYAGPEVSLETGDVDDMASETLAKIYAAQQQFVEAALVYEKLAARQPADAERLLGRAAELRDQAR